MAERSGQTDIYLVSDLEGALGVARELQARAVGLDMEGVLGNYVGNAPYTGSFEDFMRGDGEANMALAHTAIHDCTDVDFGIVTNNSNKSAPDSGDGGLVSRVGRTLGVPFMYKGMQMGDTRLRGKPSGDLSRQFCEETGIDPEHTVLIDDQGVKNAGEAIQAGLRAIIAPDPIGLPGRFGGVREHMGVEAGRLLEPRIYKSLQSGGWLARVAYSRLAGVDISSIGGLYDRRAA